MKYLAFAEFHLPGNFGDSSYRIIRKEFQVEDENKMLEKTKALMLAKHLLGHQIPRGEKIQVFQLVDEVLCN